MPFTFPRIADVRQGETFVSPRTYYLTEDGQVVTQENLPKGRVSLLVAEGAQIGYEDAEKHGLLETLKESKQAEAGVTGALQLDGAEVSSASVEAKATEDKAPASKKAAKDATAKVADALPKEVKK